MNMLIATFGDQPTGVVNQKGNMEITFGHMESIYHVTSLDKGHTFSEPEKIASLEGLVLGYSSGPRLTTTENASIITASDKEGNIFSWSKSSENGNWTGPYRVNDIEGSAGEALSDIASNQNGRIFSVWIDTRFLENDNHKQHNLSQHGDSKEKEVNETIADLNKMTPLGITRGELFKKIDNVPQNSHLAFHPDEEENLYWVFLDKDGEVLKAQNFEEYRKFKERNGNRVKLKGKIYLAYSDDMGKNWSESKMIYRSPDGSVCECCRPTVKMDEKGNPVVMFRNNIGGSRDLHYVKSTDGGKIFTQAEKLGIGTWQINGCPMDGGDMMVDEAGDLVTVWQREGEIFRTDSNNSEIRVGGGRTPTISGYKNITYTVYSNGDDILSMKTGDDLPLKIGVGSSPQVIALEDGALCFWVNSEGIQYLKI
jgi:hypothetical protein